MSFVSSARFPVTGHFLKQRLQEQLSFVKNNPYLHLAVLRLLSLCTVRSSIFLTIYLAFLLFSIPALTITLAFFWTPIPALRITLAFLRTPIPALTMNPTAGRIFCANCNICVNSCNTFRRYVAVQLDPRVLSLISSWVSPLIITEDDYICEACFNLAMQIINNQLHEDSDRSTGPSHRGHHLVCLICGRSLANRQSHNILGQNTSGRIIEIIENRIAPRQISPDARTCHACWMQCTRSAVRNEQVDEQRHVGEAILENSDDVPDQLARSSVEDRPSVDQANVSNNANIPNVISLSSYRRAPNTALIHLMI